MTLFVNWHLLGDEKPIHECRVSWKMYGWYYLGGLVMIALAIALPFLLSQNSPIRTEIASPTFATIGVCFLVVARFKSRKELVLLTTERLLIRKKTGDKFFKETNVEALAFNKLDDIQVHQTFLQRMLRIGDIRFRVSGQEHLLENMDNPQELEKAIYHIIEMEKAKEKVKATT